PQGKSAASAASSAPRSTPVCPPETIFVSTLTPAPRKSRLEYMSPRPQSGLRARSPQFAASIDHGAFMKQLRIPAVFMRGGTSNAVVFNARDLPADRAQWDEIFLAAIGSPDPYGRQLDGMGGGVSSLSKVCIIGPSTRPDADIDYTFAQVQVKEAKVDYGANCGNMSAAMGPLAIDEGLVKASGKEALVRVHNTNTRKIIWARFPLDDGVSAVDGELAIPGVAGTGAPVKLEFREPGGATTGKLLPTGNVADMLEVPGHGKV